MCVCVFNKIDVANKIVCYVVVCCMTVILIYDRNDVNYGERSGKLQLKMRKQYYMNSILLNELPSMFFVIYCRWFDL